MYSSTMRAPGALPSAEATCGSSLSRTGVDAGVTRAAEMIALDDALTSLAEQYPRQAEVVELRYFGGFTVEETAAALKVSPETVARDWHFAKAFLRSALTPGGKA